MIRIHRYFLIVVGFTGLCYSNGCDVTYPDGKFLCGENGNCPPGMFCRSDNKCYNSSESDDVISGETDSVNSDRTADQEDGRDDSRPSDSKGTGGAGGKSDDQDDDSETTGSGGNQPLVDADYPDARVSEDSEADSQKPIIRPETTVGEVYDGWTYYEVQGAFCRDGSAAGYYLRKGAVENLLIFLNGGGVCYDDFFCAINPANVEQSLSGESLIGLTIENITQALLPERQVPPDEGIFKQDRRNPVADWTMVYIPYCTGDLHAGTERDASVITSTVLPFQQFVGYSNIGLFYRSFGPDYLSAEKVLLTGSSAGSLGVLFNLDRTQQFFTNSEVIAIMDSGFPFRDEYLPFCLQKKWRELWKLDAIIPADCTSCFSPDGGGLYELYGYYRNKYTGRVLGGVVSTEQDEVIKLFFSAGNNNCTGNPLIGELIELRTGGIISSYPRNLYPTGLTDYIENVVGLERGGSYIFEGTTHQHLFRDRYYETNGLDVTISTWVKDLINGVATHVGTLP
ncbi:MAG: hypothetical protein JXA30_12535 [Deltaproteobacteria bacterium]|nr:hypothetical protein [Deltaproteobacteria bacterium]